MKYQRQPKGLEEKWENVSTKEVRKVMARNYMDLEAVMEQLDNNMEVGTNFFIYRKIKN